jgi:formate hydrogenlyase subunit 3/multisubunit Na+/H+ antiporter MnhD subunit
MFCLLLSLAILTLSALAAIVVRGSARKVSLFAAAGTVAGCLIGLVPAVSVLMGAPIQHLRVEWHLLFGSFFVSIDTLSGFFLLPIYILSALAAVYGVEHFSKYRGRKSLGSLWFFFNILVASMVLVVVARNAVLFLIAWEVMSLASFFLVTLEDQKRSVYEAGWIYLAATHLATAFLLAMFILLGKGADVLDFNRFVSNPGSAGILFLLAVIGFGIKAGFVPFHVWLPKAYPAVPGNILAVMSGVMIKTAIYGILRVLTFLGPPAAWWGWTLVGIGLVSSILGVLFALAQHDLKRLLAYHSIENIGIIAMGMGIGLLGLSAGSKLVAVLGFAGALLHVLNHAVFKGLLFMGAGAVQHRVETMEMDHLGGLLKKMPWTGATFLVGAAAISALPPLNGFISEFLIYLGALQGVNTFNPGTAVVALSVIAALALSGGLAAACFAKAFGIVFLGEPRSGYPAEVAEVGYGMHIPMLILAGGCILIGLGAPFVLQALAPVVGGMLSLPMQVVQANLSGATHALNLVVLAGMGLLILPALLLWWRRFLLAGRSVTMQPTWDCGYARPTSKMQYSASSFAQPLTTLFDGLLRTRQFYKPLDNYFPDKASFRTHTPDVFERMLYQPVFSGIEWSLTRLRWLQHGRLHLYILYIMLTIVALLIWRLG